jgi:hypothetical protein
MMMEVFLTGDFKFIAGKVTMGTGTAVSSAFLNLVGKTLGTDAFYNSKLYIRKWSNRFSNCRFN